MSQLVIQRDQLVERFGDTVTLGEIIATIENDMKAVNEVVCQFKVNGVALAESDEVKFASAQIRDIEILEVFSRKPTEILHEVVKNWILEIPKLLKSNDQLSQDIRFQGIEGRLKQMVELIDSCQMLVDSIMSIDSLFADYEVVKSKNWKDSQRLAAAAIGEALMSFQKKDFNLMADVLEYDLGHALQTWLDLLQALQQDIDAACGMTPQMEIEGVKKDAAEADSDQT